MANSINRTILTGNLTRDPELRAAGDTKLCRLRVAVNERAKDATTGEWGERANYFDVTVFGAQGENAARYLSKGRGVAVDGRLRWHEWTTDAGDKRQAVEVIAESVQFLPSGNGTAAAEPDVADADDIPF